MLLRLRAGEAEVRGEPEAEHGSQDDDCEAALFSELGCNAGQPSAFSRALQIKTSAL